MWDAAKIDSALKQITADDVVAIERMIRAKKTSKDIDDSTFELLWMRVAQKKWSRQHLMLNVLRFVDTHNYPNWDVADILSDQHEVQVHGYEWYLANNHYEVACYLTPTRQKGWGLRRELEGLLPEYAPRPRIVTTDRQLGAGAHGTAGKEGEAAVPAAETFDALRKLLEAEERIRELEGTLRQRSLLLEQRQQVIDSLEDAMRSAQRKLRTYLRRALKRSGTEVYETYHLIDEIEAKETELAQQQTRIAEMEFELMTIRIQLQQLQQQGSP